MKLLSYQMWLQKFEEACASYKLAANSTWAAFNQVSVQSLKYPFYYWLPFISVIIISENLEDEDNIPFMMIHTSL